MKKIIIAIGLLLGSLSVANAQTTIKNGGLENWRTSKLLFNLTATLETPQGLMPGYLANPSSKLAKRELGFIL